MPIVGIDGLQFNVRLDTVCECTPHQVPKACGPGVVIIVVIKVTVITSINNCYYSNNNCQL